MLKSLKHLSQYLVWANNNEVGRIKDFFFDDQLWLVRYLVVDVNLIGRKVLLSPLAVGRPDPVKRTLPVSLTISQINHSPGIDLDWPMSYQQRARLQSHYSQPWCWLSRLSPLLRRIGIHPESWLNFLANGHNTIAGDKPLDWRSAYRGDPHLRSVQETSHYRVQAKDGPVGTITDFIINERNWRIQSLIINISPWWSGRRVIVSPAWVDLIDWVSGRFHLGLNRESVLTSPEYDARGYIHPSEQSLSRVTVSHLTGQPLLLLNNKWAIKK